MKLFSTLIILSLAVIFCSPVLAADTFKDTTEIRKFTDTVMEKAGTGDLNAVFKTLRPYVNMNKVDFESNVSESTQLRQKSAMQYGPPKGHAFIGEKKIGTSLYRLQYLEIAEKQAIIWSFYFLKVDGDWRLDEFDYTPRLSVLFQEN